MDYYRRYVGDFLAKTRRLTLLEKGVYDAMLDVYYAEERPLPVEPSRIFRMVGANEADERAAVGVILEAYFELREDGWHNNRADRELQIARRVMQAQRESGIKTAKKRWEGHVHVGQPNSSPNKSSCRSKIQPPTPNPQPPTLNPQEPTKVKTKKGQNHSDATSSRGGNGGTTTACEAAYRQAMKARYQIDPGHLNARQRGMLSRFLTLVPAEDAPAIVEHYVQSNRGLYVSSSHALNLLVRDADALRLAWLSGRDVPSEAEARMADKTAARGAAFKNLLDERESDV